MDTLAEINTTCVGYMFGYRVTPDCRDAPGHKRPMENSREKPGKGQGTERKQGVNDEDVGKQRKKQTYLSKHSQNEDRRQCGDKLN
uniref:Transposase n=1 Tax=Steinernema glaseri TaxID=37863 RepID=A0A1I7ZDB0_9BILA